MSGEINLQKLLKTLKPKHNSGEYVFCVVDKIESINLKDVVLMFKEKEGITVIIKKQLANKLKLKYSFVASWITLTAHSSLEAIGLTAAFSNALSQQGISCNVVAAFHHDHIFVAKKDTKKAMVVLNKFSI